jgi:hypothetical protein
MRTPALIATLSALAIGATLAVAPPAKADGFDAAHVIQADGWRHHHRHRHYGPPPGHWRRGYYPPPRVYYAPPPRYYYAPPPRVYYPPPPRYYAPQPGVGLYLRF